MRVPSRIPSGLHRIRVTWTDGQQKLERVFTFEMDNPDYGKPSVDPLATVLATEFPGKTVAVLQQGLPVEALKLERYEGCADAFISTRHLKQTAKNYGAKDHLWVGPYGGEHRTLIRYDLASLPKDAKIKKAVLRIFTYNGGNAAAVAAHRLLRSWGAGRGGADGDFHNGRFTNGMDWQHIARNPQKGECSWLMARSPEAWAQPGCGGAGTDYVKEVLATGVADMKHAEGKSKGRPVRYWIQWDVTAAAQAWARQPDQNFGVLLQPSEGGKGNSRFYSSDYADPPYRPRLVLVFERAAAAPANVPSQETE